MAPLDQQDDSDFPELPFDVSVQEDLPLVARPAVGGVASKEELAARLYLPVQTIDDMLWILRDKRTLILSGPPGVGKTYIARALADYLADGRVNFVQFHPSYSYEYFVSGYRPVADDMGGLQYEVQAGPLLKSVMAAKHEGVTGDGVEVAHVLIIDEINRANVSSVFGELLSAMEYRNESFPLQYGNPLNGSENTLNLPDNFYIIATMNKADRSVGNFDAAMWRRFGVYDCSPSRYPFGDVMSRYFDENKIGRPDLVRAIKDLNSAIPDPDYAIGPSYFFGRDVISDEDVRRILDFQIWPFLRSKFGDSWVDSHAGRFASTVAAPVNMDRGHLSKQQDDSYEDVDDENSAT